MTTAPRQKRDESHDPLANGQVRIAAVAAAMRAVKAERQDEPDARKGEKEDSDTPAVPRAA
jgi:hypothetical protein